MKIYTHWVSEPEKLGNLVEKKFFATRVDEQAAAKISEKGGFKVLAATAWEVEPSAKAVAAFCSEQVIMKEYLTDPEDEEPEGMTEFSEGAISPDGEINGRVTAVFNDPAYSAMLGKDVLGDLF